MSKVTSVRLGDEICGRLDRLAALMDRPRSWLIEQAVTRYVEDELPEVEAIREALDEYHSDRAELVPHEEVMKRLEERMRAAGL